MKKFKPYIYLFFPKISEHFGIKGMILGIHTTNLKSKPEVTGVLINYSFCYFPNSLLNFLLSYALPCGMKKTKADWKFEHRAVCGYTCEKYRLHYALLLASKKLVWVNLHAKSYINNKVSCVCASTFPFKRGTNLPQVSGLHWCFESWNISAAN